MKQITWGSVISILGGIVFIISTAFGVNAYFAKESEVKTVKTDIAMLGKAFQYNQVDVSIDRKVDQIRDIDKRLAEPNVSPKERTTLLELKGKILIEIEKLKAEQQKYK